eukprot:TRINITY_DN38056_c0_g1_i2.p1 TRINITY_DN38056_c0_g1~~TRINITY_DN38056_c0_g1_i2.p1  ORF type:complete len:1296 (-),score=132.83 TRINITY_DN38056_c0_g1_i2:194-4030(-)
MNTYSLGSGFAALLCVLLTKCTRQSRISLEHQKNADVSMHDSKVPLPFYHANGPSGCFAPSKDTVVGAMYHQCMTHDLLNRHLPLSQMSSHAVRATLDDIGDYMLAIKNVKVEELDLVFVGVGRSSSGRMDVSLQVTRKRECQIRDKKKLPSTAACIHLVWEDVTLVYHGNRIHFPAIAIHVVVGATLGVQLADQLDEYADPAYAIKLELQQFEMYAEDWTIGGKVLDKALMRVLNSNVLSQSVRQLVSYYGHAALDIPQVHEDLLRVAFAKRFSLEASFSGAACEKDDTKTSLCVKVSAKCTGLFDGSQVLQPTPAKNGSVRSATSLILPSLVANTLERSQVYVKLDMLGARLSFAVNFDLVLDIEQLLNLFAHVAITPKTISHDCGPEEATDTNRKCATCALAEFHDKHRSGGGWLSFTIPTEQQDGKLTGAFALALKQPSIAVDVALAVRFHKLADGRSSWYVNPSGKESHKAVSLFMRMDQIDCSFIQDQFDFSLCAALGNSVDIRHSTSGSFLVTEDAELMFCTQAPCGEGLQPLWTHLVLLSPFANAELSMYDGTLSVRLSVEVTKMVAPLSSAVTQQLLLESVNGPPWLPTGFASPEAVRLALLKTEKEGGWCGFGINKAIGKAIRDGNESPNLLQWVPSDDQRKLDEARIEQLSRLPQVNGKTHFFLRFDPLKADIEVLSWERIGANAQITLRAWQPDFESEKDAAILSDLDYRGSSADVRWILELGGAESGSMAPIEVSFRNLFLSHKVTNAAIQQLAKCREGICYSGARVGVSLRFIMLSDGQVMGCFGRCCKKSVEIGDVELMTFGSKWLAMMKGLIKTAKATVGSFITELLGKLLANLLEIPLRMALGVEASTAGTAVSFNVQLSTDIEEDRLTVRVENKAYMSAGGISSVAAFRRESDNLIVVEPTNAVAAAARVLLSPGLKKCSDGNAATKACMFNFEVPIDLTTNSAQKTISLHVKNVHTTIDRDALAFFVSQKLARGARKYPDVRTDFCLADLDTNSKLRRDARHYEPLSRVPDFEAPLDLLSSGLFSEGLLAATFDKRASDTYSATATFEGTLKVPDMFDDLRHILNDAGVADDGFVRFHPAILTSSAGKGRVELRCGALFLNNAAIFDLTDPLIQLRKSAGSVRLTDSMNRVLTVEPSHSSNSSFALFTDALELELRRQRAFRFRAAVDKYSCKMPMATVGVHAQPPKVGAFYWVPPLTPKVNPSRDCIDKCGRWPACMAVLPTPGKCAYLGGQEMKGEVANEAVWRKVWITSKSSDATP